MNPLIEEFKTQGRHLAEGFKKEISGVRSNRPTPALLEDLKVSCYGQIMPLKQVSSINIVPPREMDIHVWDKDAVSAVTKAIESSGLGLSASAEGNIIRVFLPELSKERREELTKHLKHLAEESRIKLRHFRDETNKKIQKALDNGEISEDAKFKLKKEVQDETDKTNEAIEKILERKIKEVEN